MENKMTTRLLAVVLLTALPLSADSGAANGTHSTEEFLVKDLKVILKPNPDNDIISVQLYIKGGVLNVTEENQGIEQFMFDCALLQDKKYAEKGWNKIFSGVGAGFGTVALKDFTVVQLRCTRPYFEQLWEAYTDYILKSGYFDYYVDLTRERRLTSIRQRNDRPEACVRSLAEDQFYAGHPYHLNPAGTRETISKITIKDMESYFKHTMKKSRLLLVVSGNVDKADLKKKVSKTFGKLSKGRYTPVFPKMVVHTKPALLVEERQLPTNYILGLFPAPSQRDADFYAMTIAVDILKWRLFEEIRTKRNLSYAPDAFLSGHFSNYGGVYATSVDPDSTVKVMLAELNRLKHEPVDAKDLHDRINMYLTRYYLSNESNDIQGQFLAQFEISGVGWRQGEKMVERLRTVTAADVQRVANTYFRNLQFVYLGDPKLIDRSLFTSM